MLDHGAHRGLDGVAAAGQGRVVFGGDLHGRRPRRATIARQVEGIGVEAALGHVVHPGLATERQIEGRARVGGAVHEEDNAIGLEAGDTVGVLVAHEDLPIAERHGQVFAG